MSRAKVSTDGLHLMKENINSFLAMQEALVESLSNTYRSLGEEWSDPQYDKLGVALEEAKRALSGSQIMLEKCPRGIDGLIEAIDDYNRQRF